MSNAFNHPFCNRDLLGQIIRTCMRVGPVTACMLASTCRLAWSMRAQYESLKPYWRDCNNGERVEREYMRWDMWYAYARRVGGWDRMPDWALDNVMCRRLIPLYPRVVFHLTDATEEDYVLVCKRDGYILAWMHGCLKSRITDAIATAAVTQNGEMIRYVPPLMRNAKLWNIAATHPDQLMTFPKDKITQSRIVLAMRAYMSSGYGERHMFWLLDCIARKKIGIQTQTWSAILESCDLQARVLGNHATVEFYTALVLREPAKIRQVPQNMQQLVQDGVNMITKRNK
jgi:hypothetical protein